MNKLKLSIVSCRIIPFRDSRYLTESIIEDMEKRGLQGFAILMEGVRTGSAYVTVRLKEKPYQVLLVFSVWLVASISKFFRILTLAKLD